LIVFAVVLVLLLAVAGIGWAVWHLAHSI
jgi:hypothetical protein